MDTFQILIIVEIFLVAVLVIGQRWNAFLSRNAIVVGVLVGFAIFHLMNDHSFSMMSHSIIDVALAVVIYLAGVEVGWEAISKHIGDVIFFGFAATLLGSAFTTLLLTPFTQSSIYFVLLAGVSYVPTDPVLVFNQLGRLKLPGRVLTVIQGESILNDPLVLLIYAQALSLFQQSGVHGSPSGGGQLAYGVVNFFLQVAVSLVLGALCFLISRSELSTLALKVISPIIAVAIYVGAEHFSFSPYLPLFIFGLFSSFGFIKIVDLVSETSEIAVVVAVSSIIPFDIFTTAPAYLLAAMVFVLSDLVFRPLLAIAYFKLSRRPVAEGATIGLLGLKGSLSLVVAAETFAIAHTKSERMIVAAVAIALSFSLLTKGEMAARLVTRFALFAGERLTDSDQ
jgi:CPA1 family monovalent cation:H+ antiporter